MFVMHMYGFMVAASLSALLFRRICLWMYPFTRRLSIYISRYMVHKIVLPGSRYFRSWSLSDLLSLCVYYGLTFFVLLFRLRSIRDIFARAGTLSLINTVPLVLGLHHHFSSDVLWISVRLFRRLHSCIGTLTILTSFFYTMGTIFTDLSTPQATSPSLPLVIVSPKVVQISQLLSHCRLSAA